MKAKSSGLERKNTLVWLSAIWCPKQIGRELAIRQLNLANTTREYFTALMHRSTVTAHTSFPPNTDRFDFRQGSCSRSRKAFVTPGHADELRQCIWRGDNPREPSLPQSHVDRMKPTLRTHQAGLTLRSDLRRAVRLDILSRVLLQQVTPWSHASTICAIPSTSHHIPAPLKSSQNKYLTNLPSPPRFPI